MDVDNGHADAKVSEQQKPAGRGGWSAAIFILLAELTERFAYFGLSANLITYLTNELHEPISTASKNVNMWTGLACILPVLGALIADSFLGRFKTIILASIIYFMGTVVLVLSASVIPLHRRKAVFFVALYMLIVGEGVHKPCVHTFAADQFEEDSEEDKKTKSSFFNWWFLGIMLGSFSALLVVVYVQENVSWVVGFGMLAIALAVSLAIFLLGIKRYLDKAMIIDSIDAGRSIRDPWRLCFLNEVEEVKLFLRFFPIWLSCIVLALSLSPTGTYYTKQGSTMIRSIGPHFDISPATLQGVIFLTSLITTPIYDRIFVRLARKFTGLPSGITVLQRIGIGLFMSPLIMAVSALVEAKRIGVAKDHKLMDNPKAIVPMKVWWLLPQYILTGLSDFFIFVGLQELFYIQMPEAMRSIGGALCLGALGLGFFMSSAMISVVQKISLRCGEEWLCDNLNRAHLDYYYWLLAGLSALSFCVYVWIAKSFEYKNVQRDDVPAEEELTSINGHQDGEA
ncbi:Protein NRT1/ PTR FAMILY 5.4 [Morella rubra]|uniref:Protein NRT1/ PTR FAMILY 5.4 n=1 Tax=Morella rubra TaxID=262757 RepID=A0A6A1UL34_9ROSI|nr:Protein NRT1/ PTR FAMILY 5.4 [Morella rubra]KAB1201221.1 Protein NRT1/ PTR FAMILY 5.4 [Morella rubra]